MKLEEALIDSIHGHSRCTAPGIIVSDDRLKSDQRALGYQLLAKKSTRCNGGLRSPDPLPVERQQTAPDGMSYGERSRQHRDRCGDTQRGGDIRAPIVSDRPERQRIDGQSRRNPRSTR